MGGPTARGQGLGTLTVPVTHSDTQMQRHTATHGLAHARPRTHSHTHTRPPSGSQAVKRWLHGRRLATAGTGTRDQGPRGVASVSGGGCSLAVRLPSQPRRPGRPHEQPVLNSCMGTSQRTLLRHAGGSLAMPAWAPPHRQVVQAVQDPPSAVQGGGCCTGAGGPLRPPSPAHSSYRPGVGGMMSRTVHLAHEGQPPARAQARREPSHACGQ